MLEKIQRKCALPRIELETLAKKMGQLAGLRGKNS